MKMIKASIMNKVCAERDELRQKLSDYRDTIAQQAELLAAHKAEMQDWQRELLAARQQLAEAQRVTFDPRVLEQMNELEQQRDELLKALDLIATQKRDELLKALDLIATQKRDGDIPQQVVRMQRIARARLFAILASMAKNRARKYKHGGKRI